MKRGSHILHIESMRAIAALMVLLFHFISYNNGNTFLVSNGNVRNWSEFGAQGVEMFYIISGYVMTLSLSRKKYRIRNFGRYLLKRGLRILPLYWSVILSIVLIQLVLWGSAPDGKTIFANLFFLAGAIEGTEWLNLVFGTLGVEVQFYLLLGLIFPLIRRNLILKYVVLLVWLLAGFFSIDTYSVLSCAPFFIIGIVLHDLQMKIHKADLLLILGIVAGLFWIKWYDDIVIICLTMVLFLVVKPTWKPLTKVGEFSYSMYLTHGIFGSWLLYFASWESYGNMQSAWLILPAILFSLAGAYVFYHLVEKPSIRWSKKIKMHD